MKPSGTDLLKKLIELLADQECVKISCEFTEGKCENK